MVILHTEVEAEPEATFPYRMWEYNALLTLEHQPPVVSIALLPFMVGRGIELARYTETAFGQEYTKLEYWRISLRGLDAAEYLAGPALGAALAALMRPGPGSRVDLKAAIFARLRRGDLAPGTRALFFNFVQTYLQLSEAEQAAFARRMAPEGDVTMETLERTWLDEQIARGIAEHAPWTDQLVQRGLQLGIEQGIQQGIEQGIQRGIEQGIQEGFQQGTVQTKREVLSRLVRARFGTAPADLESRIARLDAQALDRLIDRVLVAASPEALLQES